MPEMRLRGAASELLRILDPRKFVARDEYGWKASGPIDILLEGPGGTGKSTTLMACLLWLAENFPRTKILLTRLVRKDLNDSHLRSMEELLPNDHPVLRGATRQYRQVYRFPNGSEIIPRGLDRPGGMYSTQYDVVVIGEAWELGGTKGEDTYQQFYRALRNNRLPNARHYFISDTNPAEATHHLNRKANAGKMIRLKSKHVDNPTLYRSDGTLTEHGENFMAGLERLVGPRRERLLLGNWYSAEGMIWPDFSSDLHLLRENDVADMDDPAPVRAKSKFVARWYIAGQDWGFTKPGCLHVYGIDSDGRACLVREVYRAQKSIGWWVAQAQEVVREYKPLTIECDPSEPGFISDYRQAGLPAVEADNDVMVGLDEVRMRFAANRLFISDAANVDKDPILRETFQPLGLADEIPGYVYHVLKGTGERQEVPDPDVPDHGCDTLRYVIRKLDRVGTDGESGVKRRRVWTPGSLGAERNMPEWMMQYVPADQRPGVRRGG